MGLLEQKVQLLEQLFRAKDFQACRRIGTELFDHPQLPRYVNIKICCMLAFASDDWTKATSLHSMAEKSYWATLKMIRMPINRGTQDGFAELRQMLDDLKEELLASTPVGKQWSYHEEELSVEKLELNRMALSDPVEEDDRREEYDAATVSVDLSVTTAVMWQEALESQRRRSI